jgi:dTDP-4-dehydrorhamnose 3,5-epimerase
VYAPQADAGIMYNDPQVGIEWPKLDCEFLLSEKDTKHPLLKDAEVF